MKQLSNQTISPDSIGLEIRRCREKSGLTLRKCAGLIGVSPTWLSNIEKGQSINCRPSPEIAQKLFMVIGMPRPLRFQIIGEWRKPELDALAKWDAIH